MGQKQKSMQHRGLRLLCQLYALIERLAYPPVKLVVLVSLSKADGGHRLIGLLAGLMRLWGKVRRHVALQWEFGNDCGFFWGGVGRSTSDSAHQQLLKTAG